MRKLFIAFVIVVFLAYCYGAYHHYAAITVPGYEEAPVDLLGGKSISAWKEDTTFQLDHIMNLERSQYQPMPKGLILANGKVFPADAPLSGQDFREIIEDRIAVAAPTGGISDEKLRDPSKIQSVAMRSYHLRDRVILPAVGSASAQTIEPGTVITKSIIDQLLASGVGSICIIGHGDPVSAEPASMALIMLIFLALVMALREVLWEPLLTIIDERQTEIVDGAHLLRANRKEESRLEDERKRLHGDVRRSYLDRLHATQREALKEAEGIYNEAKVEASLIRDKSQKELTEAIESARSEIRQDIPALARAVTGQILGRDIQA